MIFPVEATVLTESLALPLIILALALGSAATLVTDSISRRLSGIFTSLLALALFGVSVVAPISGTYFTLFTAPYIGEAKLFADGMSLIMVIITLGLSSAIAVYATGFGERRRGFFSAYLLLVASLIGVWTSANLLILFLFLEMLLLSAWALIGLFGGEKRGSAAMKYFIYKEAAALLILAGILILGGVLGTFDLLAIYSQPTLTPAFVLAIVLILVGLLIKAAAFPLHDWLPDAYCEAPYPATSLFSFTTVAVGAYTLVRIFSTLPVALEIPDMRIALAVMGIANILFGGLIAISKSNTKRLLAYSSVSQVGYVFIGIASGSELGFLGTILFSIAHGLAKPSLFMISGVLRKALGTEDLGKISGLAGKMPATSSALLASFLSLGGIPPLAGFWGELFIFLPFAYALMAQGLDPWGLVFLVVVLVSTIFTAAYGLWAARRALYGPTSDIAETARDPQLILLLPILILVAALVVIGLYPALVTQAFWIFAP